jgi:adenylate cyclase
MPPRSISIGLLIVAIQLLPLAGVYDNLPVERLENLLYDQRLILGMPNTVDEHISIVEVDEASLAEVGRWPWPRKRLAELIDVLFEYYQIQLLGIDAVFAEAQDNPALEVLSTLASGELAQDQLFQSAFERLKPELHEDRLLADRISTYPVVLGYYFQRGRDALSSGQLPEPIFMLESELEKTLPFPAAEGYVSNIPLLQQRAWSAGFIDNPRIDDDGIVRRVSLVQRHQDFLYESLALSVTRAFIGSPPVEIVTAKGSEAKEYALDGVDVGGIKVPTDEEGAALVPFRGAFRQFTYVSASAVLSRGADRSLLEDRIVLLGFTAPGLMDVRPTPVQKAFPGVELHANLISGMLDDRIKQRPASALGIELVQMLAVGLILTFLLPYVPALIGSLLVLGVTAMVVGANFYAWQAGLVLPLAGTLVLISTLYLFFTLWGFVKESLGRRWLSRLFREYAPAELVDVMAKSTNQAQLDLKGENREMTVLFTDIRGFTPLSESLNPHQVSQMVNIFLDRMTEILYRHRGSVEKYTGDGFLAFWGAPKLDHQHARHALQTAMEMAAAVPDVCRELERQGLPSIKIGIGLSTGMINVGVLGSKFRRAYMVQGDSVNLGARIEGLTKFYGSRILVNAAVKHRTPEYAFRFVDRVKVKGKDEPVELYEPVELKSELNEDQRIEIEAYDAAIALYRQQDWGAAAAAFVSLANRYPECLLYSIYLERSQQHLEAPPEAHDGVFTHASK